MLKCEPYSSGVMLPFPTSNISGSAPKKEEDNNDEELETSKELNVYLRKLQLYLTGMIGL
jgi:hypothetical protein